MRKFPLNAVWAWSCVGLFVLHKCSDLSTQQQLIQSVSLRPYAYCDCRFESPRRHERLSGRLLNVVCCRVEVSANGRSLVQSIPTECVCVCLFV
jgi:hypothetical protein